jgi:hypothetical protein
MRDEPLRQDADFDRDLWRGYARRDLQEAFRALEDGRMTFGSWERLFLSAAIDHFRYRNFKLAAMSAQRIFNEHQRQPFAGRFGQEKSLTDLRAEYEELARMERGYPGSIGF